METKNIFAMIDKVKSAWDKDHPQTVIAKFTEVSEQYIKDSDYKGLLVFFKQCLPMTDMLKEEILSVLERVEDAISALGNEPLKALFFMVAGQAFRRSSSGGASVCHDDHHGNSDCRQIRAGKFTFLVGGDHQVLFYLDRISKHQLLCQEQ